MCLGNRLWPNLSLEYKTISDRLVLRLINQGRLQILREASLYSGAYEAKMNFNNKFWLKKPP